MTAIARTSPASAARGTSGFTLIELAVVLAIIVLMLGGLLVPLATQLDASRYERARTHLDSAKQALTGFAIANNNRLPCPDIDIDPNAVGTLPDVDGLADPPGGGACTVAEGRLPYATLGVQQFDPWGNRLRYRPDPNFTVATGIPAPPLTIGGLSVQDRAATPIVLTADNTALPLVSPGPAALLFSCGKNGFADAANNGDNSLAATANCGAPASPLDGVYNQDVFVDGVFDDLLDWISTQALLARLVSAGTWPG